MASKAIDLLSRIRYRIATMDVPDSVREESMRFLELAESRTPAAKRLLAQMERNMTAWESESRARKAIRDKFSWLPAGLHAHPSLSRISESQYASILDAGGNELLKLRVSGHVRPSGPEPHEFGNWDSAIEFAREFIGKSGNNRG